MVIGKMDMLCLAVGQVRKAIGGVLAGDEVFGRVALPLEGGDVTTLIGGARHRRLDIVWVAEKRFRAGIVLGFVRGQAAAVDRQAIDGQRDEARALVPLTQQRAVVGIIDSRAARQAGGEDHRHERTRHPLLSSCDSPVYPVSTAFRDG